MQQDKDDRRFNYKQKNSKKSNKNFVEYISVNSGIRFTSLEHGQKKIRFQ